MTTGRINQVCMLPPSVTTTLWENSTKSKVTSTLTLTKSIVRLSIQRLTSTSPWWNRTISRSSKPQVTSGSCIRCKAYLIHFPSLNSHANPPLGTEAFFATILTENFAHTSAGSEKDLNRTINIEPEMLNFEAWDSRWQRKPLFSQKRGCRKICPLFFHIFKRFPKHVLGLEIQLFVDFARGVSK